MGRARKPQPGRVNNALLSYLRQGALVVCPRHARTVSKFTEGERREREAIERQRESLARAATRAYYERNADKVRAATRAYYEEHKDKWRTVYAENRKRAALRAAQGASSDKRTNAPAPAADTARAARRSKGVALA